MMPLDSTTLFLIFCVQLLIIAPKTSDALSCPEECDTKIACAKRAPVKCAYGRVLDACGCCFVCGNGPNEPCGGEFLMLGMCGKGLECRSNHATEVPEFAEGICVRTKAWIPRLLKTEPYAKKGTRRNKPIKFAKMQEDGPENNKLPPGFKIVTPHNNNKPTFSTQPKRRPLKNI